LIGLAVYLDLHGSTPYPQALALPLSYITAYFESPTYLQHSKNTEAEGKVDVAVIGRLDVLIKSISVLSKTMAGRR